MIDPDRASRGHSTEAVPVDAEHDSSAADDGNATLGLTPLDDRPTGPKQQTDCGWTVMTIT